MLRVLWTENETRVEIAITADRSRRLMSKVNTIPAELLGHALRQNFCDNRTNTGGEKKQMPKI